MEDVKALRRIVFDSRLNISEDILIVNMSTTQYTENDMNSLSSNKREISHQATDY